MRTFNLHLFFVAAIFIIYLPIQNIEAQSCSSAEPSSPCDVVPTQSYFPGGDPVCDGLLSHRFEPIVSAGNSQTFDDGNGNSITITIYSDPCGTVFSWEASSNVLVNIVRAKGGGNQTQNTNEYNYSGLNVHEDSYLHSPTNPSNSRFLGLSHVDFCYSLINAQPALPIKISDFSLESEKDGVTIRWTTASESNNDYFTVERMIPERSFEAIGTVSGAGNSSVLRNYDFIDQDPFSGINYYRLKQTDFDGGSTYTDVKMIEYHSGQSFGISYDRHSNAMNLQSTAENITLAVVNLSGSIVESVEITDVDKTIQLPDLPTGLYIATISDGRNRESFKFCRY